MAKTLCFHEARQKVGGGIVPGPAKYLMISEVHRIDALREGCPAWNEEGHRSVIVCKGKDGTVYHTVETAEELRAQIER